MPMELNSDIRIIELKSTVAEYSSLARIRIADPVLFYVLFSELKIFCLALYPVSYV